MIDKELIKQEIERLKQTNGFLPVDNHELCDAYRARGYQFACNDILRFIDSLPEEPSQKFKIGDTIRDKEGETGAFTITDIKVEDKSLVYLGNKRQKVSIWCQDDYEIVNNDLLVKENPVSDEEIEALNNVRHLNPGLDSLYWKLKKS